MIPKIGYGDGTDILERLISYFKGIEKGLLQSKEQIGRNEEKREKIMEAKDRLRKDAGHW